mmetsp:Transcript_5216/g.15184  ORF Transcript_5216/g.15184 Transcript_5216/m.15184 type:complete len:480 (-) Transcript_5216:2248-3687(-)
MMNLAFGILALISIKSLTLLSAFQPSEQTNQKNSPRCSAYNYVDQIEDPSEVGASPSRDIKALESWAEGQGVYRGAGFVLSESDDGDWSVAVTSDGTVGERVLRVPSSLVISSVEIRQEKEIFDHASTAIEHLKKNKLESQVDHFLLWLKVLREYEKGEDSKFYPWLSSLPRTFSNAICMDEAELGCLAPFAWSMAKIEILHKDKFIEALQSTSGIVSQETREDYELLRWAFNVVFTRCWGQDGDEEENRKDLVPMGDMFNHRHPGNVAIVYDEDRNCNIILKGNVKPGDTLHLSYGFPTNPYRFLVVFGFVDESLEAIYSQLLSAKPTKRHVDMGYNVEKMTFNTTDGSFTEEVWDFVLYSLLEQVPEIQEAYYDAHVSGNEDRKNSIRRKFYLETCIMLKKHVDKTLLEMENLINKVDQYDINDHDLLPMIRRNNIFVAETFSKVKYNVDHMIQEEMVARKAHEKQQQQQKMMYKEL